MAFFGIISEESDRFFGVRSITSITNFGLFHKLWKCSITFFWSFISPVISFGCNLAKSSSFLWKKLWKLWKLWNVP
nr:MAG TPA: hypothetical protein [Caudoviricetes sp.]